MKSAIIFDLDGTLYSSRTLDEENRLAAIGALSEFKGVDSKDAEIIFNAARMNGRFQTSISKTVYLLGIPDDIFKKHQLKIINPEGHLTLDPELVVVFGQLRTRFKLAIYTNTRKELVPRILRSIGLEVSDFDCVVAGGDAAEPKPSTTEMLKLLSRLGVMAEECYMVGDRWGVDLEPAQAVGITPVHVNSRDKLISWIVERLS